MRVDSRANDCIREVKIATNVSRYAEGSTLISVGHTKVLCTCTIDNGVPHFRKDLQEGWLTAEYSMLPRATHTRTKRDRNKVSGRTVEIQRLIGRSLRAALDFKLVPDLTFTIDCDVIQADGGTRVASITGAWVALKLATAKLSVDPVINQVAAISIGIVNNELLLDLDYLEDSNAEVDSNIVLVRHKGLVEFQTTAEQNILPFSRLNSFVELAKLGIEELFICQDKALKEALA